MSAFLLWFSCFKSSRGQEFKQQSCLASAFHDILPKAAKLDGASSLSVKLLTKSSHRQGWEERSCPISESQEGERTIKMADMGDRRICCGLGGGNGAVWAPWGWCGVVPSPRACKANPMELSSPNPAVGRTAAMLTAEHGVLCQQQPLLRPLLC